jgi:hypothetical protein
MPDGLLSWRERHSKNCRETFRAAVTNRTVSGEQRAAEIPAAA